MALNEGELALAAALADTSMASMLAAPAAPDTAAQRAERIRVEGESRVHAHQALPVMLSVPDKLTAIFTKLDADTKGLGEKYVPDLALQKRDELRNAARLEGKKLLVKYAEAERELRNVSFGVTVDEAGLPRNEQHKFELQLWASTVEVQDVGSVLSECNARLANGDTPFCKMAHPILKGLLRSKKHYQDARRDVQPTLDRMKAMQETSWTHARSYAGAVADSLTVGLRNYVRYIDENHTPPDLTAAALMLTPFREMKTKLPAPSTAAPVEVLDPTPEQRRQAQEWRRRQEAARG